MRLNFHCESGDFCGLICFTSRKAKSQEHIAVVIQLGNVIESKLKELIAWTLFCKRSFLDPRSEKIETREILLYVPKWDSTLQAVRV
jgi:hypothetical protein